MATYVNDLRLKEITTGDESGTWGTSTNTNLSLIADAFSYATKDCFATDADATETMADGSADEIRSLYLKVTSSATLTATRTLTLAPNTVSKVWIIENATTGSQSISISQGSGANVTIPNGDTKVIYTDGAGATAAVTDAFANLKVTDAAQTNITSVGTLTGLDVAGTPTFDGLTVDGTVDVNLGSDSSNIVSLSGATAGRKLDIQSFAVGASVGAGYSINATSGQGELDFQTTGTSRLNIDFGGDISFYEDTGTTAKLFWDASAESLGIGTTSPSYPLSIEAASPTLQLKSSNTTGTNTILFSDSASNFVGNIKYNHTDNSLSFATSSTGSERMRIDASGNLLVGKTSAGTNVVGFEATPSGYIAAVRDGGIAAYLQRKTSDGDIVEFRKDSTTVGSIGVNNGANLYIGSEGQTGLKFGSTDIVPADSNNNGTSSDADMNLGNSGTKFKDLYLSGTATVGDIYVGAGSAGSPSVQMNDTNSGLFAPAGNTIAFSTAGGERMRIDSGGDVLVNCTSIPSASIRGFGIEDLVANVRVKTSCSTTAGFAHYEFFNPGGSKGNISTSAAGTSYNTSSDYRLKENIQPLADGLDRVQQLKPVQFDWKESGETSEGFIAHEVQEIFSDAVSGEKDGEDMQGMDYGRITPLLVKAIQEQQTLIEQLQAEVALLKGE